MRENGTDLYDSEPHCARDSTWNRTRDTNSRTVSDTGPGFVLPTVESEKVGTSQNFLKADPTIEQNRYTVCARGLASTTSGQRYETRSPPLRELFRRHVEVGVIYHTPCLGGVS